MVSTLVIHWSGRFMDSQETVNIHFNRVDVIAFTHEDTPSSFRDGYNTLMNTVEDTVRKNLGIPDDYGTIIHHLTVLKQW